MAKRITAGATLSRRRLLLAAGLAVAMPQVSRAQTAIWRFQSAWASRDIFHEFAVDYAKTRVQFGQPIANFQALQHRLVRMKINEEEARAAALFATLSLDGAVEMRARAISGAKAKIGRCARLVHQEAIQLHGAIGTTNELSLGGYARRLIAYENLFGSTREHLRRYGTIIADPQVAAMGLLLEPATAGTMSRG